MKNTKSLIFVLFGIFLSSIALIFAGHLITTSTGTSSYSLNQSIVTNFTILVRDSDTAHNISVVNITIPSAFTFYGNTNGTNATTSNFSNYTTSSNYTLSWNKTASLVNATYGNIFTFNASSVAPGTYNFTVTTGNMTGGGSGNSTNISVTINDTAAPVASLGNFPVDMYNYSSTSVVFGVTCSDNSDPHTAIFYGNWSGAWAVNATNASVFNATEWNITVTGLEDGIYLWGAFCNDSATYVNNVDAPAANRTIVIDTTNPSPSISCSPTSVNTGGVITCSCTATDATSGVNTSTISYTVNPSTALTGTFTQTCSVSDYAGNSVSTSSNQYSVESGTRNSGTGGSTTPTTFWTAGIYDSSEDQFVEGFTREYPEKQRVKVIMDTEIHYVGVIDVASGEVTINVSSTPQQAKFVVGEEKKFEVTGDSYYDVYVKLNSINEAKANLTIQKIKELIPAEELETISQASSQNETGLSDTSSQNTSTTESNKSVLIGAIVIIIIIAIGMFYKFKTRETESKESKKRK